MELILGLLAVYLFVQAAAILVGALEGWGLLIVISVLVLIGMYLSPG
ncbi:hypothetical protein N5C66_03800 [Rhizobium pusense]|uniref:Uncharacterized protein n=1 Tax=Agrobacterium genomosp. 2 str. CFBP 5494 TaxID=1183436 RepID=A0A9W5EYE1_9HYPH|nr:MULTISPECIES: hypothetical protein [Rhizobium/Agrobacterium group]MDH0908442.1 hypothetical protein [Agrobacterium pusense]MDH1094274.1 hypothetical protein [Agrobacterium pusense]MDH1110856.1 hypothetical protein [Agrobacterium pusense]MDH2192140.1 hypothetical protein [Agrobacterium pusense]CAD7043401.1 hypothetical protein RP007_01016 [Rhizobium sp. P007]